MTEKQEAALWLARAFIEDAEDQLAKPYSTGARYAITAIDEALADRPAQPCGYPYCGCNSKAWCKLERMAENARELGLDYEPPCKTGSQCTSKCQQCEQPAKEQKLEFVSPGGGYVPAIPRPIPLDWKLVPRKATPEMLRAMDECAQEGYDERLYEGMASSVYMAAWDASPVMETLPEQPAQQQEPVVWMYQCSADSSGPVLMQHKKDWAESGSGLWTETPLYTSPQQSKPWVGLTDDDAQEVIEKSMHAITGGSNTFRISANTVWTAIVHSVEAKLREKNAQPSKPLTDEQRKAIVVCFTSGKVSVSEVQRKLAISYNEAQQLCQSIVDLKLAQGLQLAPSLDRHGIKGDA